MEGSHATKNTASGEFYADFLTKSDRLVILAAE
jgi:hypothetical protein